MQLYSYAGMLAYVAALGELLARLLKNFNIVMSSEVGQVVGIFGLWAIIMIGGSKGKHRTSNVQCLVVGRLSTPHKCIHEPIQYLCCLLQDFGNFYRANLLQILLCWQCFSS